MTIDKPTAAQIPGLRRLWKQAFGDEDAFLDVFFTVGYAPERCRCITENGEVIAALYWFNCALDGRKLAYIYAVATSKAHRGKGLCHTLMAHTHEALKNAGYAGSLLVPGEEGLFRLYETMGYRVCSRIREFSSLAGSPIALRQVSTEEYAIIRRSLLPPGGILQEGENLAFLAAQGQFYTGESFALCAMGSGDPVYIPELLGDAGLAPGIVAALGAKEGRFRTPGAGRVFAMYRPISGAPAPEYFAFAFD